MSRRPLWRRLLGGLLGLALALAVGLSLSGGLFRQFLPENLLPAPVESRAGFSLHMIDVGQGQAILLTCGGKTALIDTGLPDTAGRVVNYLYRAGVRKLDYLFLTHPHSDHCGGARDVARKVGADVLILPEYLSEEAALATAADWVGETDTPIVITRAGKQYPLGEALLTVLHPAAQNDIDDMNDLSLVLLCEYQGRRMLFTGDISAEVEQSLLPLGKLDVLQVSHHGSGSASGREFLADTRPALALISCGAGNDYGHPHESVLERLEEVGAQVRRTDREGTLIVTLLQGQISVKGENK